MGNTTRHAFPYPEGTDLVTQGDDAIQALAEAVDATLAWSAAAVFPRAESPAAVGSIALVSWGAPAVLTSFTYDDAGTLTYTGPARLFMVDAEVQIGNGGAAAVSSAVEVRLNGNAFAGSYDATQVTSGSIANREKVHRVSTPVRLSTGNTLDVTAQAGPAGTLGLVGLRVYPMGPAS